jgi:hypothetical protein
MTRRRSAGPVFGGASAPLDQRESAFGVQVFRYSFLLLLIRQCSALTNDFYYLPRVPAAGKT